MIELELLLKKQIKHKYIFIKLIKYGDTINQIAFCPTKIREYL